MGLRRAWNRSKAFVSFDAMFSIIPALIMLMFVLSIAHTLTDSAAERMHRQEVFDKLVSVADYVVKQGAAETGLAGAEQVRYPNWINENKIDGALEAKLKAGAALSDLSISLDDPASDAGQVCIYRLVVTGQKREIKKLYVCGD